MQGNSTNVDDFFSISSSSTQDEFWPSNSSEWTEVAPEEQGLNSIKISEMFEYIENLSFFALDSVIIVRNGYLITEEYLHNNEIYRNIDNPKSYYGNTTIHYQASVTKSLMSILIGIALQEGFLTNLNQKLYEFYADIWESGFIYGEQKKNITIEQLLTMNSGLIADWHALYPSDAETKVTTNSIKFALEDVPLGFTPGAEGEFTYSND
ncbi:unnamed protein product, partial [marine sediment metagenome]